LFASFVVQSALFIYIRTQRLNEPYVSIYSAFVIFIHAALLLIQSAEVLLEVEELVLERPVVALSCSEIVCFL
jgi:Co/Zn/Cd efflux system component